MLTTMITKSILTNIHMLLLKHLSVSIIMKQWAWLLFLKTTAFYRTSFKDDEDFTTQLKNIYEVSSYKES